MGTRARATAQSVADMSRRMHADGMAARTRNCPIDLRLPLIHPPIAACALLFSALLCRRSRRQTRRRCSCWRPVTRQCAPATRDRAHDMGRMADRQSSDSERAATTRRRRRWSKPKRSAVRVDLGVTVHRSSEVDRNVNRRVVQQLRVALGASQNKIGKKQRKKNSGLKSVSEIIHCENNFYQSYASKRAQHIHSMYYFD